ncbi:MAG: hypothetical protein QM534_03915 [Sediminibacterium sp.]|nr:hypothetical protein [Sediminibacterium sp.]
MMIHRLFYSFNKNVSPFIMLFTVALCLMACSDSDFNRKGQSKAFSNPPKDTLLTAVSDSMSSPQSQQLESLFVSAITEYINVMKQKEGIVINTLFLGKNADFPDVQLPDTINHVGMMVLPEDRADAMKLSYSRTSPYVNAVGWINQDTAEFIFVTFYPEFKHQFDYHVYFRRNEKENGFILNEVQLEDYRRMERGKPERIRIDNKKYQ